MMAIVLTRRFPCSFPVISLIWAPRAPRATGHNGMTQKGKTPIFTRRQRAGKKYVSRFIREKSALSGKTPAA
jgi:hypothetical protein